jgi:hypothetical protein
VDGYHQVRLSYSYPFAVTCGVRGGFATVTNNIITNVFSGTCRASGFMKIYDCRADISNNVFTNLLASPIILPCLGYTDLTGIVLARTGIINITNLYMDGIYLDPATGDVPFGYEVTGIRFQYVPGLFLNNVYIGNVQAIRLQSTNIHHPQPIQQPSTKI